MRALCDSCESAPAIVFCAADEAALCGACDEKVHLCNKLANRHIRVGLANPSNVPRCDICENSPAFFYCEVDGSSLCLQCDTIVHVGGKRTHERYLLLRQRVEFPGDKLGAFDDPAPPTTDGAKTRLILNKPQRVSEGEREPSDSRLSDPYDVDDGLVETDATMIDLNLKPHWIPGQASNDQTIISKLENMVRALERWSYKPSAKLWKDRNRDL